MARTPPPPRAWQRMLSGRRLDLLDPSPFDVEIEDIAHGLARVARWNGQTRGQHAFSVAQHSVVVEDFYTRLEPLPDPRWQLAALLHDASEYVIGDMISPFKAMLGGEYKDIESRLMGAIHLRFALPVHIPAPVEAAIKRADRASAHLEALQLVDFEQPECDRLFGKLPSELSDEPLVTWPAEEAALRFLLRFTELEQISR